MTQRATHRRSRLRPAVAGIAAIAAIASVGVMGAGPALAAGSACDVATAQALVTPDGFNPQEAVASVYCDAFLGPSRPAMLAVIRPQCGCGGNFAGWFVYGLVDGAWVPTSDTTEGLHNQHDDAENVTVSGTSVIETRAIHRRTDWFHFAPTGGTQTRTWSWDGGAGMAATAWVQQQPPQAPGVVALLPRTPDRGTTEAVFHVSDNRVLCEVEDDRVSRARCTAFGNASAVTVSFGPRRPVRVCRTSATRACQPAEAPQERGNDVLHAPQSAIVGRFTCRAGPGPGAVRCTLASGRGFTIGSHGARRLGQAKP